MKPKTKKIIIVSSILIVGYIIYKKNKDKNKMIADSGGSGLLGLGLFGII